MDEDTWSKVAWKYISTEGDQGNARKEILYYRSDPQKLLFFPAQL